MVVSSLRLSPLQLPVSRRMVVGVFTEGTVSPTLTTLEKSSPLGVQIREVCSSWCSVGLPTPPSSVLRLDSTRGWLVRRLDRTPDHGKSFALQEFSSLRRSLSGDRVSVLLPKKSDRWVFSMFKTLDNPHSRDTL